MGDWRSRSMDWFHKSGAEDNKAASPQTYADYLKWDEFATLRLHESVTVTFEEEGSLGIKIGVERGDEPDATTIHYIQGLNDTDDQGQPRQLDALAQLRVGDVITHVNRRSIVQMDTPGVLTQLKNPERPMSITVMRHNSAFERDVQNSDKGFAEDVVVVRKDVARYVPETVSPEDLRDLIFFESANSPRRRRGRIQQGRRGGGGGGGGGVGEDAGGDGLSEFDPTTTDDDDITDDELQTFHSDGTGAAAATIAGAGALLSDSESVSESDLSSDDEVAAGGGVDAGDVLGGDPLGGGSGGGGGSGALAVAAVAAAASPSRSAANKAKTVRRVQRRLTDVLLAVTRRLQQTSGYAQGMHSVVALFLGAGLTPECAFWMMVTIVERLGERGFYASSAGSRVAVAVGSVRGISGRPSGGASTPRNGCNGNPGGSESGGGGQMSLLPGGRGRRDSSSTPSQRPLATTPRKSRATSAYHDISVMLQETEVVIQLLKLSWPILQGGGKQQQPPPQQQQQKRKSLFQRLSATRRGSKPDPAAAATAAASGPAGARAATEGIRMISPNVLIPLFVGVVPLAVTLTIWDDLFNVKRDAVTGRLLSGGSVTMLQAFVAILDMHYASFESVCTGRRPESTRVYAMLSTSLSQIDPQEFRAAFETVKSSVNVDLIEQCRAQARQILTLEAERRRRSVRLQNVRARFEAWADHQQRAAAQYLREFGGHLSHLGEAVDDSKAPPFTVVMNIPKLPPGRASPGGTLLDDPDSTADPPFDLIEGKLQKLGRSTMKWKGCQCQLTVKHLLVTQGRTSKPIELRRVVQVMGSMAAFEIFEDAATDTVFGLDGEEAAAGTADGAAGGVGGGGGGGDASSGGVGAGGSGGGISPSGGGGGGGGAGSGRADLKWHTFRALHGTSVWVWKKWLRELLKVEWGEDFFHEEFDDDVEQWVFYNSETHNTERLSQLRGGATAGGGVGAGGAAGAATAGERASGSPNGPTPAGSPTNSNAGSPRLRGQEGGPVPALRRPSLPSSTPTASSSSAVAAATGTSKAGDEWHDAETSAAGGAAPPRGGGGTPRSPQVANAGLLCPFCKAAFDSKPDLKRHVVGCMPGGGGGSAGTPTSNSSGGASPGVNGGSAGGGHGAGSGSARNGSSARASGPGGGGGGGGSGGGGAGDKAGDKGSAVAGGDPALDLPMDITGLRSQAVIRAAKDQQVVENTFRSQFGAAAGNERGFVTSATAVVADAAAVAAAREETAAAIDDEWQPELLE